MAYTYLVNTTPSIGAIAMYQFISTLISAGWSKTKDSDGTTYSSSGVQVTGGGTGTNGLANTNAWVVLQAPSVSGAQRSITIQRGTTNVLFRIKYSAAAGFTGGSPAAGVTPTATDEVIIVGGGTDASPTFTSVLGADASYRQHIACGGSAEGYSFWFFCNATGTPALSTKIFYLDVLLNPLTSDPDPAVIGFSATNAIADFLNAVAAAASPFSAKAWLGTLPTSSNNVPVGLFSIGGYTIHTSTNLGVSPWTSKDVVSQSLVWVRPSSSAAPIGVKGLSRIFQSASTPRTNMDTLSISTTMDHVYIYGCVLPWNGTTPTI